MSIYDGKVQRYRGGNAMSHRGRRVMDLYLDARGAVIQQGGRYLFSIPEIKQIASVKIHDLTFPNSFHQLNDKSGNNQVSFIVYIQNASHVNLTEEFNPSHVDHAGVFKFTTALTHFRTDTAVNKQTDLNTLASEINSTFNSSAFRSAHTETAAYTLNVSLSYDEKLDKVKVQWTNTTKAIRFRFHFQDILVYEVGVGGDAGDTVNTGTTATTFKAANEGMNHTLGASRSVHGVNDSWTTDVFTHYLTNAPSLGLIHPYVYLTSDFLPNTHSLRMFEKKEVSSQGSTVVKMIHTKIPLVGVGYGQVVHLSNEYFKAVPMQLINLSQFEIAIKDFFGNVMDMRGHEGLSLTLRITYE